jgi:predicted dehydrogenase
MGGAVGTTVARVGVLGTGFISRTHSFMLKRSAAPNRIVAVHDPVEARAAEFAGRVGARVARSEEEVLDEVDVVFVTTWTSEHERLVALAAERGVAVFCEKPLGVDAASAERIVDNVETAGVASQVGLVLRFVPQVVWARHLLADERAGRLMAVSFRDDQFIPVQGYYDSTWRADPVRCGRGTLLEHSVHDVDVLRWWCGPVTAVSGVVRELHGHERIDDVAVCRLDFASGGVASLTSIWHDLTDRPSQRAIEIFAERLYVSLDATPDGTISWQFAGEPPVELAGDALVAECIAAGHGRERDVVSVPGPGGRGGAMFNPVTPFLDALAVGGPSPLPLREALVAHRLVDAIYRSADAGGDVIADPESSGAPSASAGTGSTAS